MTEKTPEQPNRIKLCRKRMGFSQKRVAQLLGYKDTSTVSRFERGFSLPPLLTALRLGIILRTPVEHLWEDLYMEMRKEIREQEEILAGRGQQMLF